MSTLNLLIEKDEISSTFPLFESANKFFLLIIVHFIVSVFVIPICIKNINRKLVQSFSYYAVPSLVFLNGTSFALHLAGSFIVLSINGLDHLSSRCERLTDSLLHNSIRYAGYAYFLITMINTLKPVLLMLSGHGKKVIYSTLHSLMIMIFVYTALVYHPTTAILFFPQTEGVVGILREAYFILTHSSTKPNSYSNLRKTVIYLSIGQSIVLLLNGIKMAFNCATISWLVQLIFAFFMFTHHLSDTFISRNIDKSLIKVE